MGGGTRACSRWSRPRPAARARCPRAWPGRARRRPSPTARPASRGGSPRRGDGRPAPGPARTSGDGARRSGECVARRGRRGSACSPRRPAARDPGTPRPGSRGVPGRTRRRSRSTGTRSARWATLIQPSGWTSQARSSLAMSSRTRSHASMPSRKRAPRRRKPPLGLALLEGELADRDHRETAVAPRGAPSDRVRLQDHGVEPVIAGEPVGGGEPRVSAAEDRHVRGAVAGERRKPLGLRSCGRGPVGRDVSAHRRASFRISRAALCPDTPITPPPGCVADPHW